MNACRAFFQPELLVPTDGERNSSRLRNGADTAVPIAESPDPVRCAKGMRVIPDHTLDDHPALDVLLVPGGRGARERECDNPVVTGWIAKLAEHVSWVTTVCTGSVLLHAAGPARGRRVATHWSAEDALEQRGDVTVVRDARYVVDGYLVTSQGVSAGIDMALWLVGRINGRAHARTVRRYIQYEPAPPYLADEPSSDPTNSPEASMTQLRPTTQEVLQRNITALNARDIEGYLAIQQPDVGLVLPGGVTLHGRDELRQYMQTTWEAFPDGTLSFAAQVLTDDTAATELIFTGTHTSPMLTPDGAIPPTGRTVTVHAASILRIKDGLIASEHVYQDQLELMTQLGLTGS